jgi:hypothetical protein
MNTTEKNSLIAEFMGFELEETLNNKMVYAIPTINNNTDFFEPKELQYHSNWNCLIEAIEKCRESQIFGTQRLISNIDERLLKLDLLATYSNVVDFITFLNNVPKEEATEEKDLFEYYQDQPENVKSLLSEYENYEELNHEEVKGLLKNIKVLGYTFDYGLCCQPFNLRKI